MAPGFSPLDHALALAPGRFAPRLVEGMVRLGTWMPFGKVPEMLAFFTGVRVDADTVRRITERAGAALVAVEAAAVATLEATMPAPPPGPAVQQVSVDGAMVPLVGGVWGEVKTLAIGTVVGEQKGVVRTTALSYCSRLADAETFSRVRAGETYRRGTARAGVVCAVMDGATWLQEWVNAHCPDAVRILDFPHAAQHLALAAAATFGAGSAAARTWREAQCHTRKHTGAAPVLTALRALPVAQAGAPVQAGETRDAVLRYLETRREQIAYADFAARGYPIGSGMVESANTLVVEARLKGSGMHWAREQVNPMVALRALACGERWDEGWQALWRYRVTARPPRCPPVSLSVPPLPASAPPARAVPLPPRQRNPLVVHGKPTAQHPWRKRLLPPRPPASPPAKL